MGSQYGNLGLTFRHLKLYKKERVKGYFIARNQWVTYMFSAAWHCTLSAQIEYLWRPGRKKGRTIIFAELNINRSLASSRAYRDAASHLHKLAFLSGKLFQPDWLTFLPHQREVHSRSTHQGLRIVSIWLRHSIHCPGLTLQMLECTIKRGAELRYFMAVNLHGRTSGPPPENVCCQRNSQSSKGQ